MRSVLLFAAAATVGVAGVVPPAPARGLFHNLRLPGLPAQLVPGLFLRAGLAGSPILQRPWFLRRGLDLGA